MPADAPDAVSNSCLDRIRSLNGDRIDRKPKRRWTCRRLCL